MSTTTTQTEALDTMRKLLPAGATVRTQVKHVSRSGMTRVIAAYVVEDNDIRDISQLVATALGRTFNYAHWGVKSSGYGMDMTFELVYQLSQAIYPDGYKCNGVASNYTPTGRVAKHKRCNSNDHSNGGEFKRGLLHRCGGYALNNRSL